MSETKRITIEPNYDALFRTMLREAVQQTDSWLLFSALDFDLETQALALRSVQRWFAPLVIAAQSMTTREAVEQFRDALGGMLTSLNATAARLEAQAAGNDEMPEGGEEGLL